MKTKADFRGEKQLGKLGDEKDEVEEPVTEQKKEYTYFRSFRRERDDDVACYASALASTMRDEALRKAEI